MSPSRVRCIVTASACSAFFLGGCTATPQPISIYEGFQLAVQIEQDSKSGSGHGHPASLSKDRIAAALRGLRLEGRDFLSSLGFSSGSQKAPAFSDHDAGLLAPYLSAGLAKASQHDLVTFHLVQRDGTGAPLVTSGGLFVRGQHLYIILANAKSSPSGNQYETIYEPNSRLNPLLPITRFRFVLHFVPREHSIPTGEAKKMDDWDGYFDETKVVVVSLDRLAGQDAAHER